MRIFLLLLCLWYKAVMWFIFPAQKFVLLLHFINFVCQSSRITYQETLGTTRSLSLSQRMPLCCPTFLHCSCLSLVPVFMASKPVVRYNFIYLIWTAKEIRRPKLFFIAPSVVAVFVVSCTVELASASPWEVMAQRWMELYHAPVSWTES